MKKMSQHTEWLSMVEVSGPFLAIPVLEKIFPQGLDSLETYRKNRIRSAYEEWLDAAENNDPHFTELHLAWVNLVLKELLEFDDNLLSSPADDVVFKSLDGNSEFRPNYVIKADTNSSPLMFVSILPEGTDLEKVKTGDGWPVPIYERMSLLCRHLGVRLGLITNGERWMLVNAPVGNTSSHTSWYARLWFQEPITLKAFQSLLGVRRWFGPEEETLSAMLEESLQHHEEVTDTLGEQVKRAVEVLVQCLDKADQDRNRELLHDVPPAELYEAGLTVMMRLVFVLCAEERELLLQGEPIYDQYYAISTLRGQLTEEADQHGHEVLERRHDAWARLLAVFRAVYTGIEHETMRLPALGGSLFDPDRFPFLEGRTKGTQWQDTPARPLPIDNRTVLLLLEALQILEQRGGALMLSYKALDVEQIGHVYEGLLEHTVQRLPKDTLGLTGSQKAKNPNIPLAELESARLDGDDAVIDLVQEVTQRSKSAITKALSKDIDDATFGKVITVCGGDLDLANRIKPFAHLLRMDAWGDVIVYRKNSFAVTLGADRRETGTHYTPKSLTESIVNTTLEPVAYIGPADGKPREEWQIKSPAELLELKICDPAMGSGAFLVQVCRWLSERLVESWGREEDRGKFVTVDGIVLDNAGGAEPMPNSLDERLLIARRLVAERCLYGVDMNPLAVELAKLSIWLITLAKGRPFGFLDHNLRSGDSLLGIHDLKQLYCFDLHANEKTSKKLFAQKMDEHVNEALVLRKKLRDVPIRDIQDVQYMARLDKQARQKLERIEHIADAIIGEALASGGSEKAMETSMQALSAWASAYIDGSDETGQKIISSARKALSIELPAGKPPRKPFHWALEFPEVFERGGFDGIVGNPPFMGGSKITGAMGTNYRFILVNYIAGKNGNSDLVAYFFLRASRLIGEEASFGFLSTKTISQGDTREIGLDQIITSCSIYAAKDKVIWPGKAAVVVSWICLYSGAWEGRKVLNDQIVDHISSFLGSETTKVPFKLSANKGASFTGNKLTGMGFIIEESTAQKWIESDSEYKKILFKYMNGNDLNGHPNQEPSRWCINFWDWPEDKAEYFSYAYAKLERSVKTERSGLKRKSLVDNWWIHGEKRPAMYHAIGRGDYFMKHPKGDWPQAPLKRILVITQATKFLSICFVDNTFLIDQACIVFPYTDYIYFGLLTSNLHEVWCRQYSSTLGSSTMYYTPSDVFETFPFPTSIVPYEAGLSNNGKLLSALQKMSEDYHQLRSEVMLQKDIGLTDLYNKFHCEKEGSESFALLRNLQENIDYLVLTMYGWDDIDLQHSFYDLNTLPKNDCTRFTISEESRREVLQRLLKLNHERYAEEVAAGLHDKKKKAATSRKKKAASAPTQNSMDLFDNAQASSGGAK